MLDVGILALPPIGAAFKAKSRVRSAIAVGVPMHSRKQKDPKTCLWLLSENAEFIEYLISL